jgi:hypothetical protein
MTSAPCPSPTPRWEPRATVHHLDTRSTTTGDDWVQGWKRICHAVEAIRGWKMYETGWTKLCWPEAPIKEGTVVGILGHHFGLWSLNACRIAYVIEEEGPLLQRYGFAFGTLPAHVERGEGNDSLWSGTAQTTRYSTKCSPSPVRPTRWPKRDLLSYA